MYVDLTHHHPNGAIPANLLLTTLTMSAGSGLATGLVGGVALSTQAASAGTGANLNETVLWSYSMLGSTLATDEDEVSLEFFAATAAGADTKTFKVYAGATSRELWSGALDGLAAHFTVRLIRLSATTQLMRSVRHDSSSTVPVILTDSPGETLSGAVLLKITGQNGTATANHCVINAVRLTWWPGV